MIDIAKGKANDQKVENADFVRATPFDDVVEEESCDAVLAFNFLHLLEDTPAGIRRIRDLLKPDGVFISKTVCLSGKGWPSCATILRTMSSSIVTPSTMCPSNWPASV